MSDFREKAWQGAGMVFGALASWPTVSKYLGTLPDFSQALMWGTGVGFIFGLFFFTTQLAEKMTVSWRSGWKALLVLLVAGAWVYLNWKLPQVYSANLEIPNITKERLDAAKQAVMGLAFLWSAPLTYIGGVLGEKVASGPKP